MRSPIYLLLFSFTFLSGCSANKTTSVTYLYRDESKMNKCPSIPDTLNYFVKDTCCVNWQLLINKMQVCNNLISEKIFEDKNWVVISVECDRSRFLVFNEEKIGPILIHKISETREEQIVLFEIKNSLKHEETKNLLTFPNQFLSDLKKEL